ncbi:hypothetical protein [Sagittula stellata]|uniref:hypothetical protein n=1 Tax=Sagittula stellata TaxID=52603 RepID=UPI0012F48097|nr:hypothetical protein [Sagittula stellata]
MTLNLIPFGIRLFVVVVFLILLLGGKVFVPWLSEHGPITSMSDGTYEVQLPLSEVLQGKLVFFGIIAATALFSLLVGVVTVFEQHKRRTEVETQSVSEYLQANRFKRRRVVLVLRPFDCDGFLILPERRGFWHKLLFPVVEASTIEQLVRNQTKTYEDVDVLSVVAPQKDELVPGPTYVTTDIDWKKDVTRLINTAEAILFVLPPGTLMSPGLKWEFFEVYAKNKEEKSCAIFPPMREKSREIVQIVSDIIERSGNIFSEDFDLNRVILMPWSAGGEAWYEIDNKPLSVFNRVHSDVYKQALGSWLSKVLSK